MLPFERIKREILVKRESETDPSLGCAPSKRTTEEMINYGIVNINKPKGPTSHQVSDYTQRILEIDKGGHSGTLDPGVTGVLPIALGRATRIVQNLLTAGKEYVALMHLHKEVDEEKIRRELGGFIGKIEQLPPIKSAVKRELRVREVYYVEVLDIVGQDVLFKIGCQAGTYIRKYIHDFGKKIGVGAHMAQLRRTKAGPFGEDTLVTLQDLADAYHYLKEGDDKELKKVLMPIEKAVEHLPKIWVVDKAVDTVCHGASLNIPGISKLNSGIKKGDIVAVMTLKDELVGVGEAKMDSSSMVGKEKGIAVLVKKVFMSPGLYGK